MMWIFSVILQNVFWRCGNVLALQEYNLFFTKALEKINE
jgi:hypothetical protein